MMIRGRNTKIIATLGPASSSLEKIEELYLSGVDVFRLNFSHGSHETHLENIQDIRSLEKKIERPIGILGDLQGPKLRVGMFEHGEVELVEGQSFSLVLEECVGDKTRATLPHKEIFQAAEAGMHLLLDDGKIRLKVARCSPSLLETEVLVGGILKNKKGVNVPGVQLPISALTEKDKKDLDFILEQNIEWIALSFVQTPEDLKLAKGIIKGRAKIASKLEKPLAIQHLEAIVEESDAVMVARGDLGVELPPEDVPVIQKKIIRACRSVGKPVIVATQMLESMISAPTPTRAEASDVANAIYDHVDAVMLSAETASGQYPKESVSMMHRIITSTEKDIHSDYQLLTEKTHQTVSSAITAAAREIAQHLNIKAIVTLTESGETTYAAAKERPRSPILALTKYKRTARELMLCWGAYPLLVEDFQDDSLTKLASSAAKQHGFAKEGERIIITSGIPFQKGSTNVLKVVDVM